MPPFGQKPDPQSDSKKLSQLELLPAFAGDQVSLDVDTIKRQPTMNAAIVLCVMASGLDRKQVYGALGLDAATWSRIESGQANFPPNKLHSLMHLCGNEAPLIWLQESLGYDSRSIVKHRNDDQRRIAELEQENADLKRAFGLIAGLKR